MKPEKKDYQKWRLKFQHGDATRISEESKVSRQTISRALNGGSCDQSTIDAINKFYNINQNE